MGHIRDGVRKHKEKVEEKASIWEEIFSDLKRTQVVVASPTAVIHTQFWNTLISQPVPNHANLAANTNTFGGSGGGQGSLFSQNRPPPIARMPSQPRAPATEADKTALRA